MFRWFVLFRLSGYCFCCSDFCKMWRGFLNKNANLWGNVFGRLQKLKVYYFSISTARWVSLNGAWQCQHSVVQTVTYALPGYCVIFKYGTLNQRPHISIVVQLDMKLITSQQGSVMPNCRRIISTDPYVIIHFSCVPFDKKMRPLIGRRALL